jgi:hypothetical protein
MVILGEVLVVAGSALVVTCAVFWAWSLLQQRFSQEPDEGSDRPPEARGGEKSGS